jgi:hypothetical protein
MISNQKTSIIISVIILIASSLGYYLWHHEILGIGNWGSKEEKKEEKNCDREISKAIEDHKEANKLKKENRKKKDGLTLAPGKIKMSPHDFEEDDNYVSYGNYGYAEQTISTGTQQAKYLTKDEAYPDCENMKRIVNFY